MPPGIERILVVQTAFIGDVILATPLAEAINAMFPGCRCDYVVIPAASNLLEQNPKVNTVWRYDKRGRQRGMSALWRFARSLRQQDYDVALVPHRSLRSAALVRLAGIPRRIGFDRSTGSFLFSEIVKYRQVHEIERNLELLARLGEIPSGVTPRVYWNREDEQAVADCLAGLAGADRLYAIAPGSVWPTKRWLPERFAELAKALNATRQSAVILIGGSGDRELCEEIRCATGERCVNTAGQLTLRQSAALLSKCRLLISNDSAPTHLGIASGCQVLTIFGPTVPRFGFYPYGEDNGVVELKLPCRPCTTHGSRHCPLGTHACMRELSVAMVLKKVEAMLNRGVAGKSGFTLNTYSITDG